jgi:hypothetical protein
MKIEIQFMQDESQESFQITPQLNPLPTKDAIRIRAAEYWLKLGEADQALRELEGLQQTWNHPSAVKIRVAAIEMLNGRGKVVEAW